MHENVRNHVRNHVRNYVRNYARGVLAAGALVTATGAASNAGASDPTPETMAEVTVSAGALTQRRLATTGKQVLGHEEIMAYGDTTLADVLRRLPGITVDAAPGNEQRSTIRMHGLGDGYTLVMLNGVPAPAGFSFDSLAPALVERVEVLRAATAESGSQAIAGTIKIVLKKTVAPRQREVTLGESTLNGRRSANLAASLSGREGAISYVMAATAERKRSATPSAWLEESGGADGQLTTVAAVTQQGHQELAVQDVIIDDQDRCYVVLSGRRQRPG
jgi:outer membrane cobalamin receptor